jgi:hypothetical protein
MSEMSEMVTVAQAERAIAMLAVVLPPLGLLVGAVVGAVRRRLAGDAVAGLLGGLAGPAIWVMWRVYDGIVGHYGLDSVRGLLVNLVVFAAIGLGIGLMLRALWHRRAGQGTGGVSHSGKRG